jgi:hypothetical protein
MFMLWSSLIILWLLLAMLFAAAKVYDENFTG